MWEILINGVCQVAGQGLVVCCGCIPGRREDVGRAGRPRPICTNIPNLIRWWAQYLVLWFCGRGGRWRGSTVATSVLWYYSRRHRTATIDQRTTTRPMIKKSQTRIDEKEQFLHIYPVFVHNTKTFVTQDAWRHQGCSFFKNRTYSNCNHVFFRTFLNYVILWKMTPDFSRA